MINQQSVTAGRSTIGFINPAIYTLGKSTNYSSTFNDITTGNNIWPSSPNSFYAVSGYDLCTGWGTPAGQSLINALAGAPEPLGILPATGFTASGTTGGPFNPTSTTFELTNDSPASLSWSIINTSAWLQVSSISGTLSAGSSAGVTANLTANANSLATGTDGASLKFTNWNSHVVQDIPFTLKVVSSLVQNGGFETGDFTGWTLVGNTVDTRGPFGTTIYNSVEGSTTYPSVVHSGTYGAFWATLSWRHCRRPWLLFPGNITYCRRGWITRPTAWPGVSSQLERQQSLSRRQPGAFSWTNLQFIVTAGAASTVLQFGAENVAAYFGLDDVSVTHIPALAFNSTTQTNGGFNLTWATATGLVYQVQYKTNLLQTNWLNLIKPTTATSTNLSASDTSSSPQRFYRLIVAP